MQEDGVNSTCRINNGEVVVKQEFNFWAELRYLDHFGLTSKRSPFFQLVKTDVSLSELRDRAKSLWGSVAIVAALVGTIACSNITASFTNQFDEDYLFNLYVVLNFFCFAMTMLSALSITVAWANLETVPVEKTGQFFSQFFWMTALPGVLLSLGGSSLLAAYIVQFYFILPYYLFILTTIIGIAGLLFVSIQQAYTHGMCLTYFDGEQRDTFKGEYQNNPLGHNAAVEMTTSH